MVLSEQAPTPVLVVPAPNIQPVLLPTHVFIDNLEPVTNFFDQLETAIPLPSNNEDKLKFSYSDGTVKQAASVLVHFIQHFVASLLGMPAPVIDLEQDWHEVIQVRPSTIAGFFCPGQQRWSLAPAVGSGVMVPIMNAAMEEIFTNRRYFRPVGHGVGYSLSLPVVWEQWHNGISREVYLASAGFFVALYITWLRVGPQTVSGFLLQAVLNGWESISDDYLLQSLCPDFRSTYLTLSQHPVDVPVPMESSMYFLLEAALEGQEIRDLDGPPHNGPARSPAYHQRLCQATLGYHLLFASHPETFQSHSDVLAFTKGLNVQLDNCTFVEVMRPMATAIIPSLWCRNLNSPNVLLEHLEIRAEPDEDYNVRPLTPHEHIIAEAIREYLRRPGHPDHPVIRGLISAEEFIQHHEDFGLRSRLLISAATGLSSAPTTPNWSITIELVKDTGKYRAQPAPKSMVWQLCSSTGRLFYNEECINACLQLTLTTFQLRLVQPRPSLNRHMASRPRQSTRTIHPAHNADGSRRNVPTANQNVPDPTDVESERGTDYEEQDSTETPQPTTSFIVVDDNIVNSGTAGPEPVQESTLGLPDEYEIPTFRDMGDYLAIFADPAPNQFPVHSTIESTSSMRHTAQEIMSHLAELSPTQVMPSAPISLPQTISSSTLPAFDGSSDLNELLLDNFRPEWELYRAQRVMQSVSGHRAILGARLFEQIILHFGVWQNQPVVVDDVVVSFEGIADWMKVAVSTIRNWHMLELRRVQMLVALRNVEQQQTRHVQAEEVLSSLEGSVADLRVAKLNALYDYLAYLDSTPL
ncbi:hypothetical protein FRC09_017939 [Ceratobasidium sp. 395]|nr:hypothetical protein FRC09_017939 [Ceratobasidium sp. 395]